jgi:hypothetical protein
MVVDGDRKRTATDLSPEALMRWEGEVPILVTCLHKQVKEGRCRGEEFRGAYLNLVDAVHSPICGTTWVFGSN